MENYLSHELIPYDKFNNIYSDFVCVKCNIKLYKNGRYYQILNRSKVNWEVCNFTCNEFLVKNILE